MTGGLKVWRSIGRIHLDEMDAIKLMNRIDTKYVTREDVLETVLDSAAGLGYRVLEVGGEFICPYKSLYYDTDGLKMYSDHHNRKLTRQKVRTREYVGTGDTFLEVKRKKNTGRTKKKRFAIGPGDYADFRGNAAADAFLAEKSDYTAAMVKPRLETLFRRITLVNKARTERVTIDTSLSFVNYATSRRASLGPAVIIELKQDGRVPSEMKGILLDCRVKPMRISKYCIGTVLTDPSARANRFKMKVRRLEKITGNKIKTEI